jgi:DNA-binding GntR family transcriptional regulator
VSHSNNSSKADRTTTNRSNPRSLLKDQAYDQLKKRLLNSEYPPGMFLSERSLAEQLGMSKTPIKAALERLEAEGYLSVSPQQGIVVREMSVREIADQYEIRAALESYTVRALAGKLQPEQITRVQANLQAQSKLRNRTDVPRAVELDAEFHGLFVEFLGNTEILRVTGHLRERISRVITEVFRLAPMRIASSYEEHVAIADAVLQNRGDVASELIAKHLNIGKQLILSPRG